MTKQAEARCIRCDATLENVDETATNQPHKGTAFITHGHYGSTAFDPMDGHYLEITVCDDCLIAQAREGDVLLGRDRKRVMTRLPEGHNLSGMPMVVGWMKVDRYLVPWDPDADDIEDDLFVEPEEVGSESLPEIQWDSLAVVAVRSNL